MSHFPVEVLTEILLKLPAKSLSRFKCVCKSWYNLISDYEFINRHLQEFNNMHIICRSPVFYMCDFDTFDNPRNLNYPFKNWEDGGLYIVGSCRGLLCFSIYHYPFTIFLYNPTTQTYKTLPYLPLISTFDYPKGHKYLGFGYDHVTEDYKCVSIDLCKLDDGISFKSQVMVYSLREDVWKRGAHDVPYYINQALVEFGYPVFLDGIVHWSIEGDRREPQPIFGFSLIDETFSSIPLPDLNVEEIYKRAHIGVVDGCLCVILNYLEYSEIWIMKEYGIVSSWTRMYRVAKRRELEDLKPICLSKSRNELLVHLTLVRVGSLNLETLEITDVLPHGVELLLGAYPCLENLLVFKDDVGIPMGRNRVQNRKRKLRKLLMRKTERYLKFRATSMRACIKTVCSSNDES